MFIFRWISNIFAITGIIAAVLIVYFAFMPLTVAAQARVRITDVFKDCKVENIITNAGILSEQEILNLKNQIGINVPIETINDFFVKNIEPITNRFGTTPKLSITSCDVESNNPIQDVDNYFSDKTKYFSKGSVDQVLTKINQVPFIKVSNLDIQIPAILTRTSYCNTPIHRSSFYFFTQPISSKIVMIEVNLESANNPGRLSKFGDNLVQTGQYIKATLYCK